MPVINRILSNQNVPKKNFKENSSPPSPVQPYKVNKKKKMKQSNKNGLTGATAATVSRRTERNKSSAIKTQAPPSKNLMTNNDDLVAQT